MSESASGGEVEFVRLWMPAFRMFVSRLEQLPGDGFHCALTSEQKNAGVFLNPKPELLSKISTRFSSVELQPASYAEWIGAGDSDQESSRAHGSVSGVIAAAQSGELDRRAKQKTQELPPASPPWNVGQLTALRREFDEKGRITCPHCGAKNASDFSGEKNLSCWSCGKLLPDP